MKRKAVYNKEVNILIMHSFFTLKELPINLNLHNIMMKKAYLFHKKV